MFLTLEDTNARIHGSRDPLGAQPVWASFGRNVVTNLTTVTTSIREFTVLLIGRLCAEKMIAKGTAGEQDALSIFLRAEQIGSYARHLAHGPFGGVKCRLDLYLVCDPRALFAFVHLPGSLEVAEVPLESVEPDVRHRDFAHTELHRETPLEEPQAGAAFLVAYAVYIAVLYESAATG